MEGEAELQRECIREDSPERQKLKSWLNKSMKIKMGDGRTLIGVFVCTDKDQNVILGSCEEYIHEPGDKENEEQPRSLGLAMVPGPHIVSIHVDQPVEPPPKT